jgi:hypothetical protein
MDIQEKRLLEESVALARENNRLIKKIRNAALWGRAVRIVYWVLIIGVAIGAFYFLQPYVEGVRSFYQDIQGAQEGFGDFFNLFGTGEENSVE